MTDDDSACGFVNDARWTVSRNSRGINGVMPSCARPIINYISVTFLTMHLSSWFRTLLADLPVTRRREGDTGSDLSRIAREKWKKGGWNIRGRRRDRGLQARLASGACLIVCFSSIIQRPTLGARESETRRTMRTQKTAKYPRVSLWRTASLSGRQFSDDFPYYTYTTEQLFELSVYLFRM